MVAIRRVAGGRRFAAPRSPKSQAIDGERRPTLTPREVEVVELVSRGLRNSEIGSSLGISEETAQVHVKHILSKLGAKNRTEAVAAAVRRGLVHLR
jgi:DNA-binding NarL/FixJ family response regulator